MTGSTRRPSPHVRTIRLDLVPPAALYALSLPTQRARISRRRRSVTTLRRLAFELAMRRLHLTSREFACGHHRSFACPPSIPLVVVVGLCCRAHNGWPPLRATTSAARRIASAPLPHVRTRRASEHGRDDQEGRRCEQRPRQRDASRLRCCLSRTLRRDYSFCGSSSLLTRRSTAYDGARQSCASHMHSRPPLRATTESAWLVARAPSSLMGAPLRAHPPWPMFGRLGDR